MDDLVEQLRVLAARTDPEGRAALAVQLREHAPQLRFRQDGVGPVDLDRLVQGIRADAPVQLIEPVGLTLAWSPELARRWAADAVEQVLPIAGEPEDVGTLYFAVQTARRVAAGELPPGRLDAMFAELYAEEWPSYDAPFSDVVTAARQLVARDELAATPHGSGVITPGAWAAAAASAAAAAAVAAGQPERGRPYQATRLLDHLLG